MSQGKALDQTFLQMVNGNAQAKELTYSDFENFINANDLEEALGALTGAYIHPFSIFYTQFQVCFVVG